MLSAFRCRDIFFFHIENQATVVGTRLSLMIHDTADDATMTHLFQSKWKHHRNESFAIIQLEKGDERIETFYGIWYHMVFGTTETPNAKVVCTSFILQSAQSNKC